MLKIKQSRRSLMSFDHLNIVPQPFFSYKKQAAYRTYHGRGHGHRPVSPVPIVLLLISQMPKRSLTSPLHTIHRNKSQLGLHCVYEQWREIQQLKATLKAKIEELRDTEHDLIAANASLAQMEMLWSKQWAPDTLSELSKLRVAGIEPFDGTGDFELLAKAFEAILCDEPTRRRPTIMLILGTKLLKTAHATFDRLVSMLMVENYVATLLNEHRAHYVTFSAEDKARRSSDAEMRRQRHGSAAAPDRQRPARGRQGRHHGEQGAYRAAPSIAP
ncbi:hypothetical protein BC828DRAFT_29645 [Blastocladiella britannica]|nr:hypothetical protein BC828DRAFT_29645 [Blastocladiella britannica]